MARKRGNWVDRAGPLWRVGNKVEAFQLRKLGISPMAVLNRGCVLVIESTGRKTGRRRFTPVGYWQDEAGSFLIGGGAGGKTGVPDWVANLRAAPAAAVWLRRRRIPVIAEELLGDERNLAQQHAQTIWRGVPRYERMSGRVIPYFRLVPSDG